MGKRKSGTESETRKHKYLSFRDRVDAINIDPVRQTKKSIADYATESYFLTAFDNWRELNISLPFTRFADECEPLCRSLPQVIHYQNQIFDLLCTHIQLRSELSIESLLDLLTHLAHDLGPDFEPFFEPAMNLLIPLASDADIYTVEHAFKTMAYLLKYLSRILTRDLVPTYTLLSPLLGRLEPKKPHVTRFTAESLSFLLKRCDKDALTGVFSCMFDHVMSTESRPDFIAAVALLVADALMSTGTNLHSKTPTILRCLLDLANLNSSDPAAADFVSAVLENVLDHARASTATIVYETCAQFFTQCSSPELAAHIMWVIVGFRRGDRVADWKLVFESALQIVPENTQDQPAQMSRLSVNIALMGVALLQGADVMSIAKFHSPLLTRLSRFLTQSEYLAFACQVLASKPQVFSSVVAATVSPYFGHSADLESLALYVIELDSAGALSDLNVHSDGFEQFKIALIKSTDASVQQNNRPAVFWKLACLKIVSALRPNDSALASSVDAWVTWAASASLGEPAVAGAVLGNLMAIAANTGASSLERFVPFLHGNLVSSLPLLSGLLTLVTATTVPADPQLVQFLKQGLGSCSPEIRRLALTLMQAVSESTIVTKCLAIEDIPLDIGNARNLAMNIRNLAQAISSGSDVELGVRYLFGLLTSRFQPIWEASIEALKKAADKDPQLVWQIVRKGLEVEADPESQHSGTQELGFGFFQFQGLNLRTLTDTGRSFCAQFLHCSTVLATMIDRAVLQHSDDLRVRHLQLLNQIPHIAERFHRDLVPFLLYNDDDDEAGWSFKERTLLLDLFSKFNNHKGMYQFEKVYDRYLYLLGNRDPTIQKMALKCVIACQGRDVAKYQDNLLNLLVETEFKEEVSRLLKHSDLDSTIHPDDRIKVMPLVIRIIYGRAQVAKTGGVKQGRRFAIVNALNNVEPRYVELFLSLAAARLDAHGFVTNSFELNLDRTAKSLRRQLGYVTMLEQTLDNLHDKAAVGLKSIMDTLLFCLCSVSEDSDSPESSLDSKNAKSIRTLGFRCLFFIAKYFPSGSVNQYFPLVYTHLIKPRFPQFLEDNLQQPSAMLKFLGALSASGDVVHNLLIDNGAILTAMFSCLQQDAVKEPVVDMLFSFLESLFLLKSTAADQISHAARLVLPRMPWLFDQAYDTPVLEKQLHSLVEFSRAPQVSIGSELRKDLIQVFLKVLDKTRISPHARASVFEAFREIMQDAAIAPDEVMPVFLGLSKTFRLFVDQEIRTNLAQLYAMFGTKLPELARVGELVADLNSYSTRRLGLLDFDRRLKAFGTINEVQYHELSVVEWTPLLYNMVFFAKDPEEMSIRDNAAYSLRRFVDCMVQHPAPEFTALFEETVLPYLGRGLRDASSSFYHLYVSLLAHVVQTGVYEPTHDMRSLLFGGDEEANFFYNVVHIQFHRRQRALRRLGLVAQRGLLSDSSIAMYLLPIAEKFALDPDPNVHNLAAEAQRTIGRLLRSLSWNQYRSTVRRYVSLIGKTDKFGHVIKLLDGAADALGDESGEPDKEADKEVEMEPMDTDQDSIGKVLSSDLPEPARLTSFLVDVVQSMQRVLTNKDNDDEKLTDRIPISIPIVKFIRALPDQDTIETKLPGVLTATVQILRAKSPELRDLVRKTLGQIGNILGPQYLIFIVRELKGALKRGAHLHILGYSLHSLLVEMRPSFGPGSLDDSCSAIASIIIEDSFGTTGVEKDTEEYHSRMKEVRQYKGGDNAQILASFVSLSKLLTIVEPILTVLLYERLSLKTERKVEELLRRINLGLNANAVAQSQSMLVACHELYRLVESRAAAELDRQRVKQESVKDAQRREHEDHFTVQLDSRHLGEAGAAYPENLHVLKRFVFDLVRTTLGKQPELMTVDNVSGFVDFFMAEMASKHEDVQVASVRVLTLVLKLALPQLSGAALDRLGVQALEMIRSSPSTNSESCQAALRFLATMLRQKKDYTMPEDGLVYVLERIKPDMEESERQGITFTFIKAVLSRVLVTAEVYDVMDKVGEVMITNQTRTIRDVCRSAYFQFLTTYPQSKKRLDKQLTFLVSNLEYPAQAGRLSVMELMESLLVKVSDDQMAHVITSFFVGVVLVLVNDEVAECRKRAAKILGELFERAAEPQIEYMVNCCRIWLDKTYEEATLLTAGLQVSGIALEHVDMAVATPLLNQCKGHMCKILQDSSADSQSDIDWRVVYGALQLMTKVAVNPKYSAQALSAEYQNLWDLVEQTLLYPHPWVRLSASRLMGTLFSQDKCAVKLEHKHSLQHTAFKLLRQLGAPSITEELGIQIAKNLAFITKMWEQRGTLYSRAEEKDPEEEEEGKEGKEGKEVSATQWMIRKVTSVLRNQKPDMAVSKAVGLQYLALVVELVDEKRLETLGFDLILALYGVSEDKQSVEDYKQLSTEILGQLESRLGTTAYLQEYTRVRQFVADRRVERKAKRAVEAVANPELHAKKRIKKNLAKREKRRHVKDANGYYRR